MSLLILPVIANEINDHLDILGFHGHASAKSLIGGCENQFSQFETRAGRQRLRFVERDEFEKVPGTL